MDGLIFQHVWKKLVFLKSLLAALIGRNNRSGLEAELNEETRGKFDQWYMQQVFNQYRQMATLAAAQAHHQQAAAAAAAVMAATSQQQKHQAAAAALAAAVNAAAASAGAGGGSGGAVDGSVTDRNRGAAAAAAAAAAAVAAAANCQSLLNLDLDASSLASSASASGHSNHLKDNHHHHPSKHHQQQHEHHHSRGPSLASSSSSHLPLISTGRSSDSSSGERGGGIAGDRIKSEGINLSSSNNSSSGSTNSNNNLNNSSKDNGNNNSSNRTSPNAPGQYVRTRIRTSFDPEMELPKLHKWFSENQHPTRPQIQQFVKELNSLESRRGRKPLDVNNVVYWFKNARAAHKRHELKLVNGSQSPTLSNNNGNNNSTNNSSNLLNSGLPSHLRDPFDGRLGLGSRSRLSAGLIPGLIGDRMGGMGSLGSGRGGNGNGGESESYPDSNGNEDLLGQMYDDEGSDGGDYDGDDMMMDDDCSSQISQTLDLSVRPVKRQRSDSSPPGSPISGPSSLSDLIRGTPPHTVASASSCHSNFNVKDEPPSDEDDDDYDDDMDERDYYPVATGRHGLNLQQVNSSISGRSSGDAHNLSSGANYLGSDGINGGIGDLSSGRHHSSSSSSHERHHQSSSNLNNGGSHGQPDSPEEGRRARRSRTFIDPTTEVPKLEQWFHQCTHPTHPQIVQYTDELNSSPYRLKYPKLEPKNIQFWFKNRRAKSKRQNVPMSSSNTSPLASTATGSTGTSGGPNNNPPSSSSSSSSTSGPLAPVTTTTTSSSSSSSLSPSLASNCSVSSLSLATSTGPVSTSVSSSALTIDRLIGH
ncbi:homeobox protein 5-like [Panonychus citri]|uniref:homeobox protein 5-like n=1 Tax=Panonychus citri TaxID=50023 RepID=UPI0023080152|nr:homeobox protein 5-like [Panonychus citri]